MIGKIARTSACLAALFITLLLLASAVPATAASKVYDFAADPQIRKLVLVVNRTQVLSFGAAFSDQVIGNPETADILPISSTQVYVQGKRIGGTNLTVFSQDRSQSVIFEIEVTPDVGGLKQAIRQIVPEAQVKIQTSNGRLILMGEVPDSTSAQRIMELAATFVDDASMLTNAMSINTSQQVMLEVRFLEARRTATKALGVSVTAIGDNISLLTSGRVLPAFGTLAGGGSLGNGALGNGSVDAIIDALEQRGVSRRIAEPNLVTMSGEKASFLEGGKVPLNVTNDEGVTETTLQDYGVSLSFTPVVLPNRTIRINLEAGVSEPDEAASVQGVPGFRERKAQTVVQLRDGQSLVIAGLLDGNNSRALEQLPWAGNLPILGALFRSTDYQKRETELIIIITPRLIQPLGPSSVASSPLELTRSTNDAELFLGGQLERPVAGDVPSGSGLTGHMLDME